MLILSEGCNQGQPGASNSTAGPAEDREKTADACRAEDRVRSLVGSDAFSVVDRDAWCPDIDRGAGNGRARAEGARAAAVQRYVRLPCLRVGSWNYQCAQECAQTRSEAGHPPANATHEPHKKRA